MVPNTTVLPHEDEGSKKSFHPSRCYVPPLFPTYFFFLFYLEKFPLLTLTLYSIEEKKKAIHYDITRCFLAILAFTPNSYAWSKNYKNLYYP